VCGSPVSEEVDDSRELLDGVLKLGDRIRDEFFGFREVVRVVK
jgi:hypothetical protein